MNDAGAKRVDPPGLGGNLDAALWAGRPAAPRVVKLARGACYGCRRVPERTDYHGLKLAVYRCGCRQVQRRTDGERS